MSQREVSMNRRDMLKLAAAVPVLGPALLKPDTKELWTMGSYVSYAPKVGVR